MVMEGLIGPTILPRHGIAASHPFAPHEVCLMLMPVIMRMRASKLLVQLSTHMGDIVVSAQWEKHEAV